MFIFLIILLEVIAWLKGEIYHNKTRGELKKRGIATMKAVVRYAHTLKFSERKMVVNNVLYNDSTIHDSDRCSHEPKKRHHDEHVKI